MPAAAALCPPMTFAETLDRLHYLSAQVASGAINVDNLDDLARASAEMNMLLAALAEA